MGNYRYGFNGKENDNEIKGEGNQVDYGMRIYDPRIGRFLSVDPLSKSYPWYTPYQFAGNTPIQAIDLDGEEPKRPVALTGNLGRWKPTLGVWNYQALLPSDKSESGYELKNMGSSKGVVWEVDFLLWTGTSTYAHAQNMTWVMFNGTLFDATGLNYVTPKDLEGRQTWEQYWGKQQSMQEGLQRISDKGGMIVAGVQLADGFRNVYSAYKALRLTQLSRQSVVEKLGKYLLNKEHPVGGAKAKWFEAALGFTKNNLDDLAKQIVFNSAKAVETGVTEFGTKYNQVISIVGANGKTIDVTFAWIKNQDEVVRLVTAIPAKK